MKKIFIIAGEPSGDLHASNLVKSFKKENCSVDFQGWGGDLMEREGVEIKTHLKNLSFSVSFKIGFKRDDKCFRSM